MIDTQFAGTQVLRLAGLDRFPLAYPEAQMEIVIALQAVALGEADAAQLIEDWLLEHAECPKPVHFYAIRRARAAAANEWDPNRPVCPRCDGDGFTYRIGQNGNREAIFCSCRRGAESAS